MREVVVSLTRFEGKPSGGTMASALSIFDDYSARDFKYSSAPQAHLPPGVSLPPSPPSTRRGLAQITGLRSLPDIGIVGLPMLNSVDIPIVQRTWALLHESKQQEDYGPNFRFSTGTGARGYLSGLLINLAALVGALLLALRPVRWLLRATVTEPGSGPSKEAEAKGFLEQKGIALPDEEGRGRAVGVLRWKGGMYAMTAVLVAEAAATLLYHKDSTIANRLGGGICTPATLGDKYIERLKDAGIKLDTSFTEF